MEIDIKIDSLTDCLIEKKTGIEYDTEYRLVKKTISAAKAKELKKQGWLFDWSVPHKNGYEIYELLVKDSDEVQGMIALKHIRDQYFTNIDIVESAPQNRGNNKKFSGVGGHLFAIACKLSWDVGNEGYVQFVAKTNLIEHYQKELGAKLMGGQSMYIDSYGAVNLIKKYFKEVN